MAPQFPKQSALGETEPWDFLDKQLGTFSKFVEQQHSFLVDMHEFVRAQNGLPSVPSHHLVKPHHVSPALSPSHTLGQEALVRRNTVSTSHLTTTSERSNDLVAVMPMLNVYHHGARGVSAWKSMVMHEEITVPEVPRGLCTCVTRLMKKVVESPFFEPVMACVIGLNAINIGITIDLELRGMTTEFNEILESIFLAVFTVELVLRATVRGVRSLMSFASGLDSFVTVLSLLAEMAKPFLMDGIDGQHVGRVLEQVMILRMARLLRLARSARFVASLESLWKLAQGLMRSVGTMGSAIVLLFITIYIFACFGAEIIAKPYANDPAVGALIKEQMPTMPMIILTLFSFVSMDSASHLYTPLIMHNPFLAIYFLLILVIVPIALLNLITAILVEDVISTVQMDEEMGQIHRRRQLKQMTPALQDLFKRFDTSGDGRIQIREVADAIRDGLEIPENLQDFLDHAKMLDLFDALDADNSGELSEAEFVDGLTYMSMTDVDIETIQILHLLRSLRRELSSLPSWQGNVVAGACLSHPLQQCHHCKNDGDEFDCASKDSEGAMAI